MKYIMCQNVHHWTPSDQYLFSIIDEDYNVISGNLRYHRHTNLNDLFAGLDDQSIFSVVR